MHSLATAILLPAFASILAVPQTGEIDYPPAAARLAGYALMHAASSLSVMPPRGILAPIEMADLDGKRTVITFEGKVTAESVRTALAKLASEQRKYDSWAFAFDSYVYGPKGTQDAIIVHMWSAKSTRNVTIIQTYESFANLGSFRLSGPMRIEVDNRLRSTQQVSAILAAINLGIQDHPRASLWKSWQH